MGRACNNTTGKILLVDDNPDHLRLLELLLKSKNYGVVCANGGQEALQCLDKEDVDIIICDVVMPDISGPRLIEEIRTTQKFANTPVIMMTAGCEESEVDLLLSGADLLCDKRDTNKLLLSQIKLLLD